MYIKLDIPTEFEVKSLTDLPNLKNLMENVKMKVNKSQLARELNVDRRTIDKYMNGFTPKGTKKKTSKIDVHYEVIVDLLLDNSVLVQKKRNDLKMVFQTWLYWY
ncbi:transposase for insertion sequence element IS232 [Bacillus cereus VD184]|uniref:Transposase for insertion sequence element IS232 n=1 Tax=Bacillus cereus VD184 TaxID=1053242 RepID=A0A9W5VQG1_BACCE|nr:transposase for insertion sequence element IS232 [Bacillus cereus VD184]